MASIRSLIPPANLTLHSKQLQKRLLLQSLRHASTTPPPPPKPRLLEKPERFNPPSHPSRLRSRPRQYPGPPISEAERQAQKTRRYPHMMPAEGTFMHWFLTNRAIHTWITLTVLLTLVFSIWFTDFLHTTPYASLLPPNNMFYAHPLAFLRRCWEVYDMHVAWVSAQTAERRRQKVEDVGKRGEFRKAHGLEQEKGWGGWRARTDREVLGPGMREGGGVVVRPGLETRGEVVEDAVGVAERTGEEGGYADFEGKRVPVRKRWLGIW